jgi:hypothetical protein
VDLASERALSGERARRRRRLGIGLLGFGISGLVLVVAAGILVLGSLSAVDNAASGFARQRAEIVAMLEGQRAAIVAMLDPAAAALNDVATSASNAGASLTAARDASRRAADLTSRLASSFEGMASLGSFEVLGARPFAGVAAQFADVAAQSRSLSADLMTTADSLSRNVADTNAVAADLRDLAGRLTALEATVQPGAPGNGSDGGTLPIGLARLVLLGLLAWFAIPAVVSTWLGWRLTRRPSQAGTPAARQTRQ